MVLRTSNTEFLTVLDAVPLEGVGWYARVLSERDYTSQVAEVQRFASLGFTVEANAEGGGSITLDADDRLFTDPLPLGETVRLVEQEALWQIIEDGVVRAEFLAEDVVEDVVLDKDGPRSTVIGGRGTATVLEWARVLPAGMPTPTSTERAFTAHPMAAWRTLFLEAQAAGYLGWVDLTFSATEDSAGAPWATTVQALTVQAGEDLLTLLKRWCEQNELSWRMRPGFKLEVLQGAGHHREASVVFTQYRAQHEHKRSVSRRDLRNVVYADGGDLGIAIAESATSQTKWRKRAAWVSAGDSGDATARSAVANTTLAISKDQKSSRTVKVPYDRPNRHPFDDFTINDWITLELEDDASESGAMRVMGIAVEIDTTGQPTVELTLQSLFEARAIRMQRLLDKLGGSSSGGAGQTQTVPIPVSKALAATKMSDLADTDFLGIQPGDIVMWNGVKFVDFTPVIEMLANVDLTGGVDGDVLTLQGGEVVAEAPSGGGGGSVTGKQLLPSFRDATTTIAAAGLRGQIFTATMDAKITKVRAKITTAVGLTYRFALYEVNSARVIQTIVGTSDIASPGAVTGATVESLTVAWNITAGLQYALVIYDVAGSSITAYRDGTATTFPGLFGYLSGSNRGIAHTTVNPPVGTTLTAYTYPLALNFDAQSR